jgi:hypothetical protein
MGCWEWRRRGITLGNDVGSLWTGRYGGEGVRTFDWLVVGLWDRMMGGCTLGSCGSITFGRCGAIVGATGGEWSDPVVGQF